MKIKSEKLKKSSIGTNAFKGIKSSCKFEVPKTKVSYYKKIFKDKGAGKLVTVKKLT